MTSSNLLQLFEKNVRRLQEKPCLRFHEEGVWKDLSWNAVFSRVCHLADGLIKLGINRGDRVAILSRTRYEWTLADVAIMACGAVTVPIYESSTPEQVAFVLTDSQARIVFIDGEIQFGKIVEKQDELSHVETIITFSDFAKRMNYDGVYTTLEVETLGIENPRNVFAEMSTRLSADEIATFVYTSGTTGNPKGAILTHGNFMAEVAAGQNVFEFQDEYVTLLFLPLAHILARACQFFQLCTGFVQAYAESIDRLIDNIAEVRPHFMASVPRIFEKIHSRTLQNAQASPTKKKIFEWALNLGKKRSEAEFAKLPLPLFLRMQVSLAHSLVFKKLHDRLGGRLQFFISGGAPLSPEVSRFFHAFGIRILEGYGLTETTAAIAVNRFDNFRLGTVGPVIPGSEIKIAADGEICVRGPVVFKGYFQNAEATREVLDSDGWFKTGDIGVIDPDGHVRITDRKKDIIVTAAGKNIAPQNIENLLKADPYISQAVIHGDKRKFLSAVFTLEKLEIEKFAKNRGIVAASYEDLVKRPEIYELVKKAIDAVNKDLAKFETIKKFAILPHDFTVESGEITPTLKIKRKVVNQKYKEIFDSFYAEEAENESAA